ncbi:MAG: hypothetical protein PVJ72_16465, partial [Gammaproteobacteria bacterium]
MKGGHFLKKLFFVLLILLQFSCSGGGGGDDGGDGDVVGTGLGGTAAVGKPIAHARVDLRDVRGNRRDVTTDDHGKFNFDVSDLTPPFLLRVNSDDGRRL